MKLLKHKAERQKAAVKADLMMEALSRRIADMKDKLNRANTGSGFEDDPWDDYAFPPPPEPGPPR